MSNNEIISDPFAVGERFVMTHTYYWRRASNFVDAGYNGGNLPAPESYAHVFENMVEIVSTDETNAHWRLVEVVSETGRPPFEPKTAPPKGGFVKSYYDVTDGVMHGRGALRETT